MHLHKLADLLSFHEVAVGGTLPQTEYYREKLKRLHPMQMLSSNILLPLYEISLSYMTVRGNYRQAKKYAFLAEYSEVDFEAELLLKDWIAEQNARKPYRKISNVQILEIQKLRMGYWISGRKSVPLFLILRNSGCCLGKPAIAGLFFESEGQAV